MVLEDFEPEFDRRKRLSKTIRALRLNAAEVEAAAYGLAGDIETVLVGNLIKIAAEIERVASAISQMVPREV